MRRVAIVAAVAAVLLGVVWARPGRASWVSDHCHKNNTAETIYKRSQAQAYVTVAFGEGYEWGGGCWNDDNKDDTPNAPDSGGEGPDCSGLVFKTWELRSSYGADGFRWWDKLQNVHGPYVAADFHAPPSGVPFVHLSNKNRTTTLYMDGFASTTHIGLLYTPTNPSSNTDYVAEALGDAYGTDLNIESYRFDTRYTGVRRNAWTADCYPRCAGGGGPAAALVVVP